MSTPVNPQGVFNVTIPNYRYAVSEHEDHSYLDHPAGEWAPELHNSPTSIPDAHRTRTMPLYDYRPDGGEPPSEFWTGRGGPAREELYRHRAVETIDGDGWTMTRGDMTRKRAAPDVYLTPPPEPRPTNKMAPVTYFYTRPFDQIIARRLNGQHFSMADHRRTYEVYGMAPVRNRRNTYRTDPQPWDTNIVDQVPTYTPTQARITQVEVPNSANRAWRL